MQQMVLTSFSPRVLFGVRMTSFILSTSNRPEAFSRTTAISPGDDLMHLQLKVTDSTMGLAISNFLGEQARLWSNPRLGHHHEVSHPFSSHQ